MFLVLIYFNIHENHYLFLFNQEILFVLKNFRI